MEVSVRVKGSDVPARGPATAMRRGDTTPFLYTNRGLYPNGVPAIRSDRPAARVAGDRVGRRSSTHRNGPEIEGLATEPRAVVFPPRGIDVEEAMLRQGLR